ncbi:MAG: hypothetical protein RL134_2348 [Actinomycetota bacterium]
MSDSDIGGDLPPLDPELAAWLAADTPGPMPEEVWSGIEARLAAEAPLVPAGVVDLQAERRRRRPGRVLPVLAGAAGLVLVGAVVVPALQTSSPAPVADGASSAAPMVAAEAPTSADPGSVVVAPAPTATESTRTRQPQTDPSTAMPRAMVSSGTDYTADELPAQVTTLLASAGMADSAAVAAAMTASPASTSMPGVGLASSPEALADCLGRLGLPPESVPLVLDTATIDGAQGSVIVTVGAQDPSGQPTALHVVAVGQDCTDSDVAAARHWDLPLR